jgi:hypothetical protein
MEIPEISKIEDLDIQIKAIITKAIQDPTVIPAYLQLQLGKLAKAQEGLSAMLLTVEDGCEANTRKQLVNTMRSVVHQNRIIQHVINVILVYIASGDYDNAAHGAALRAGADARTVLKDVWNKKFKE